MDDSLSETDLKENSGTRESRNRERVKKIQRKTMVFDKDLIDKINQNAGKMVIRTRIGNG